MNNSRLSGLRASLADLGLDAALITDPSNRRWLTRHTVGDHGLGESGGVAVVSDNEALLLADPNNIAWARSEADSAFEAMAWERPWVSTVGKLAEARGWRRIGFEEDAMLVSTHRALTAALGDGRELAPIGRRATNLRAIKDDEEIAGLQRAITLTDHVFVEATKDLAAGVTERELARRIDDLFRAGGAEGPGFSTTVAGGPNSARPHHASSDRPLQNGEPIVIDMGARVNGYTADLTRTIVLGQPDARYESVYNSVERAQAAALARVRPGARLAEVDQAARDSFAADGFAAYVIHSVGHGIGLDIHEGPSVSIKSEGVLEIGQVVTIEPGIYFSDWGGVRIEDVALVTADGCRLMSAAPK